MKLALFFSHGVSVSLWRSMGLLEREARYYRALREHGIETRVVSYDVDDEGGWSGTSDEGLLKNDRRLPPPLYGVAAPWLHRASLAEVDVVKTNQISGGWSALAAARLFGKPLCVRLGYFPSRNLRSADRQTRALLYAGVEVALLRAAEAVLVCRPGDRQDIEGRLGSDVAARTFVIGNPVDCELFAPAPGVGQSIDVLFVGRLEQEKGVDLLLSIARRLNRRRFALVGRGPLESLVRAADLPNLTYLGPVPNHEVAGILSRTRLLLQPSVREGTSKAALEAMASGVPVVGTRVEGIRDVVEEGGTGLLAPREVEPLASALETLLTDEALRERMGRRGRAFVLQEHSMEAVSQREAAVLKMLVQVHEGSTSWKA